MGGHQLKNRQVFTADVRSKGSIQQEHREKELMAIALGFFLCTQIIFKLECVGKKIYLIFTFQYDYNNKCLYKLNTYRF